uniref:Chromatin modification-related protein MEAF6 n=1 Tax=Pinguiococcus pyrenoidosus TaxID=172671 RepID=A0A7R9UF11_9STRA|mmetsp:Transcript_8120/g.30514  ORF Transcript_8120/g.30514 Transcript_8120/m.30514 type:complete len:139 (+) Transcript_8120:80-496(+)
MEAGNRRRVEPVELVLAKKRLQDGLEDIERQLGRLERRYLGETAGLGNVLSGFPDLVRARPLVLKDQAGRAEVPNEACLFSLSSSTSGMSGAVSQARCPAVSQAARKRVAEAPPEGEHVRKAPRETASPKASSRCVSM